MQSYPSRLDFPWQFDYTVYCKFMADFFLDWNDEMNEDLYYHGIISKETCL